MLRLEFLPERQECPPPMLPCGVGRDEQAAADLLERQLVAMPPDHDLSMALLEAVESLQNVGLELGGGEVGAGRGAGRGPIEAGTARHANFALEVPLGETTVMA